MDKYVGAALGTLFTFSMTALGACLVFLIKRMRRLPLNSIALGFSSGVMLAASVWSLLLPAADRAQALGLPAVLPVGGGFMLGGILLLLLDSALSAKFSLRANSTSKGTSMLILAVTLHNIPEGMAVGLAFAGATDAGLLSGACALAVGIGIQNLPEGAAISLPLRREGQSSFRCFLMGAMSGIVEPIFGVLVVVLAGFAEPLMPWLLSFAAGAMIFTVIQELIPKAQEECGNYLAAVSAMVGFTVMMALDIALG